MNVLKSNSKVHTCNNCGLIVRTDCKEYFCPKCGNVIVGDGAYAQNKGIDNNFNLSKKNNFKQKEGK